MRTVIATTHEEYRGRRILYRRRWMRYGGQLIRGWVARWDNRSCPAFVEREEAQRWAYREIDIIAGRKR